MMLVAASSVRAMSVSPRVEYPKVEPDQIALQMVLAAVLIEVLHAEVDDRKKPSIVFVWTSPRRRLCRDAGRSAPRIGELP